MYCHAIIQDCVEKGEHQIYVVEATKNLDLAKESLAVGVADFKDYTKGCGWRVKKETDTMFEAYQDSYDDKRYYKLWIQKVICRED